MLEILEYSLYSDKQIKEMLKERVGGRAFEIEKDVRNIIDTVRLNGDEALRYYTNKFDKVDINEFQVSEKELNEAFTTVDSDFIDAIEESKKNIEQYHNKQKYSGYIFTKELGIFMGQRVIPLEKVGIYVPGGTAAYPSTVLMNAIPAKVAGVKEIIMISPPDRGGNINKHTLVAAKIAGVDKIYKLGGVQGIAALTYGTDTIPAVDKIVGPGNMYVAEAKRLVFGDVGIDMIAGPSEIVIIADESANAEYLAADLLSQAEHDIFASTILITTSRILVNKVNEAIEFERVKLERNDIIIESLKKYGKAIICKTIEEAIYVANLLAPEHLEIATENPMEILGEITNAASIFLGQYTPEALGDYFAGTNHVLPTNGTARFTSPLSVESFIKKSSFLHYSKEALIRDGEKIIKMAEAESLTAHGNAIKVRISYEGNK